ncbi:MAG TPA: DUF4233 domain-containing protein [Nocardioidaceae bacterium]|nr:DUF4233 domain-containing protein [Nocardioidaceae bacterium]
MASGVLVLEAIVLMLVSGPMILVYDVRPAVGLSVCLGLGFAALLTCGLLGKPVGVVAGSVLQAAAVALGFVVPVMFVLGSIFAALWVAAVLLGRRVDAIKAEHSARPSGGSS